MAQLDLSVRVTCQATIPGTTETELDFSTQQVMSIATSSIYVAPGKSADRIGTWSPCCRQSLIGSMEAVHFQVGGSIYNAGGRNGDYIGVEMKYGWERLGRHLAPSVRLTVLRRPQEISQMRPPT